MSYEPGETTRTLERLDTENCEILDEIDALRKSLRAMIETHGAHGPCRDHSCKDCRKAYDTARALLWDSVAQKWRA